MCNPKDIGSFQAHSKGKEKESVAKRLRLAQIIRFDCGFEQTRIMKNNAQNACKTDKMEMRHAAESHQNRADQG